MPILISGRFIPAGQRLSEKPALATTSTLPSTKARLLWLVRRNEFLWLIELPGKPRTPSICTLGLLKSSPSAEILAWPQRSTCTGVTMAWRLPDHSPSKTREYGIQPANGGTPSARGPSGSGSSSRKASPSVSSSPSSKVSLARPAAMRGSVPMPLASSSPSPRHASAAATIISSASEKS